MPPWIDIGSNERKWLWCILGKPAVTHYRLSETTAHFAWLNVTLETGRTHQIRVHLTHIGHPLVGDPVYRQGRPNLGHATQEARALIDAFPRQALHARTPWFDSSDAR